MDLLSSTENIKNMIKEDTSSCIHLSANRNWKDDQETRECKNLFQNAKIFLSRGKTL
ncbi:hypothetical protein MTR_7g092080 [Medicago truncatula]|uniref:Uncharacterized protein n=1 Tax=Medicago truncatula TaxID=3880 RepID=G7KTJ8_MEDTR|nr:hypothetical protein MTR_7g092080 [Medicago truncatula]